MALQRRQQILPNRTKRISMYGIKRKRNSMFGSYTGSFLCAIAFDSASAFDCIMDEAPTSGESLTITFSSLRDDRFSSLM